MEEKINVDNLEGLKKQENKENIFFLLEFLL